MLTPSLPNEAPTGLSAAARRRIQAGMIVRAADGTPRVGVLPWSDAPIVTGTADLAMTYQIGPFVAFTARNAAGVERIANDAVETVATTAAPSSNSRIDVIWVRSRFPLAGDTATGTEFGVTQGVANVSPSKPSIPAGALELATARVTSSDLATQTVVITPTFPYTAAAGGVVWLRNQAEVDAWAPANGSLAYRMDRNAMIVRDGGAWRQPGLFCHAGKTNGTQPTSGGVSPTLSLVVSDGDYQLVQSGTAIRVPLTGRYEVSARFYYTGAGGGTVLGAVQVNGSNRLDARIYKEPGQDATASVVASLSLTVGDTVRLRTDYGNSVFGTTGYDGCFLALRLA